MNRDDPRAVRVSRNMWAERVARYRRNWKSKPKGDPRRAYWLAQLKTAKAMLARREHQLRSLEQARVPEAPRIVDLDLGGTNLFGPLGPITGVIGHYTAGPRDTSDAHAFSLWRQYHAQHIRQGWGRIGYHYGVTADGTIALLRPVTDKGAHTAGANSGHVGIVVHGTTGDKPTAAQADAIRWLAGNAHTDALPKAHRASRRLADVRWTGHNDWNATACPGGFKRMYTSKGAKR
jgi:hypothetical protein